MTNKIKILLNSLEFIDSKDTDISFGKSYRNVVVVINNKYYSLTFYEPERVVQSLYRGVFAEPHAVIITKLTLNEIERVVNLLYEQGYFNNIIESLESDFKNYTEVDLS